MLIEVPLRRVLLDHIFRQVAVECYRPVQILFDDFSCFLRILIIGIRQRNSHSHRVLEVKFPVVHRFFEILRLFVLIRSLIKFQSFLQIGKSYIVIDLRIEFTLRQSEIIKTKGSVKILVLIIGIPHGKKILYQKVCIYVVSFLQIFIHLMETPSDLSYIGIEIQKNGAFPVSVIQRQEIPARYPEFFHFHEQSIGLYIAVQFFYLIVKLVFYGQKLDSEIRQYSS